MILSSKSILKRVERSKTNKISGRRDVTSKFSKEKTTSTLVQLVDEAEPTETIQNLDERKSWQNKQDGK